MGAKGHGRGRRDDECTPRPITHVHRQGAGGLGVCVQMACQHGWTQSSGRGMRAGLLASLSPPPQALGDRGVRFHGLSSSGMLVSEGALPIHSIGDHTGDVRGGLDNMVAFFSGADEVGASG